MLANQNTHVQQCMTTAKQGSRYFLWPVHLEYDNGELVSNIVVHFKGIILTMQYDINVRRSNAEFQEVKPCKRVLKRTCEHCFEETEIISS